MQLVLPSPLYVGNAVTAIENFAVPPVPYTGQPISEWALTDPTSVTLTFGLPGSLTTWTYGGAGGIQRLSAGVYYAELSTTAPGPWRVKWIGTGACAALDIGGFPVSPLPF